MKTITKVILILLIVGAILIGTAYALGLNFFGLGFSSMKFTEKEMTFEQIRSLDFDIDVTSVKIERNDENIVKLKYPEFEKDKYKLEISESDQTLIIKSKKYYGVNLGLGNMAFKKPFITLSLPKEANLENVNVKLGVGELETNNININGGKIKLDVGAYTSKGDKLQTLDISSDTGSIEFEETLLKESKVKADVGSVEGSIKPEGKLDFESSVGSVEIMTFGQDKVSYDIKADLGSVSVNGKGENKEAILNEEGAGAVIRIRTDVGSSRLDIK